MAENPITARPENEENVWKLLKLDLISGYMILLKHRQDPKKLDCLQSPIFPYDRRNRAIQAAILTECGVKMTQNPDARPLGTFKNNYKMAAGYGKRSISTI